MVVTGDDSSHSQGQSGKRLPLASRGHPVRTGRYHGSCIDPTHKFHTLDPTPDLPFPITHITTQLLIKDTVIGIPFRNPTSATSVVEPITGMFVFWHLDDLLPSFLCLLGCGESDVLSKGLKDLTHLVRNLIACSTTFGEGKYGQKHNSYFSGAWPTCLFRPLKGK